MDQRVRARSSVERRPADNDEPERLVKPTRGVILFVDVDGERAATELLRMRDQAASVSSPSNRGLEEERLDGMRRQSEKPDRNIRHVGENPQLE